MPSDSQKGTLRLARRLCALYRLRTCALHALACTYMWESRSTHVMCTQSLPRVEHCHSSSSCKCSCLVKDLLKILALFRGACGHLLRLKMRKDWKKAMALRRYVGNALFCDPATAGFRSLNKWCRLIECHR